MDLSQAFYGLLAHSKPLRGTMIRKGKEVTRYFYKECEWRFIPKIKRDHIDSFLYPEKYNNSELIEHNHRVLKTSYALSFSAESVKHIILKSESEIPEMYDFIEGNKRFTEKEKRTLVTRIKTLRSIKDDY